MSSVQATIGASLLAAAAVFPPSHAPRTGSAERAPMPAVADVFAQSRATYAALQSYADTGTVELEYGSVAAPTRERHTFVTYYRAPRGFYFEFTKERDADRLVVWGDDQAFHGWWRTTGLETTYPKGQGATAFITAEFPTKGSISLIAPLLFSKAGLVGTLTGFADATDAGAEDVGGHACHKLAGVARDVYPLTGHVTNARKATVWIDDRTHLVRRVVEEWRAAPGQVNRKVFTLQPHANPPLDDARLRFIPPSTQR